MVLNNMWAVVDNEGNYLYQVRLLKKDLHKSLRRSANVCR